MIVPPVLRAALLAALLVAPQEPPVPASPAGAGAAGEPQVEAPLSRLAALDARLGELEAGHSRWCELRTVGTSARGRSLRALVIGDRGEPSTELPLDRPTMLVLPALDAATLDVAEALVELAANLLQDASRDGTLAATLARTTLVVLPAPLPDESVGEGVDESAGGPSAVSPVLDYPVGWNPFQAARARAGPGPWPLARPESLAIAEFLLENPSVAAVLIVGGEGGAERAHRPGTLEPFCREALGVETVRTPFRSVPPSRDASSESPIDESVREAAPAETFDERVRERLSNLLPQPRLLEPAVTRYGEDLWTVELALENRGELPREASGGRQRDRAGSWGLLRVVNVDLRAAMLRGAGDATFVLVPTRRAGTECGMPAGGERTLFRAVLRATPGTECLIEFESPRTGARARRAIVLGAAGAEDEGL